MRKSLSIHSEPTRSFVVTRAAAIEAGIGDRAKSKWSQMFRVEYPCDSTRLAQARNSSPELAVRNWAANRNGRVIVHPTRAGFFA